MRAAITGGSGFIGTALLRQLGKDTDRAALFRRRDATTDAWANEGCRVVYGDLEDGSALAELTAGADVVLHCAARMGKSDLAMSQRVNVDGTERLARAASAQGVRRFVYVSSISVFSSSRRLDGTFTEDTEPTHLDRLNTYSYTKYLGERVVADLASAGAFTYTIIRPTNVYGPGSRSWFWQFEKSLRRAPVALGNLPIDVVHVEDLVTGILQAAREQNAANEIFHLGHQTVSMADFIAAVGAATAQRAYRLPAALDFAVRWSIDHAFAAATGKVPSMALSRRAVYPHSKATAVFGYAPRIALDEGFAEIARWYRTLRGAPAGSSVRA